VKNLARFALFEEQMSFIADESKAYTTLNEQCDNDLIKSLNVANVDHENSSVQVDEEEREAALIRETEKEINDHEDIETVVKVYYAEGIEDKRDHNRTDDESLTQANAAGEDKEREAALTRETEKEIDDKDIETVVKVYYAKGIEDKRDHNGEDADNNRTDDESLTQQQANAAGEQDKEREAAEDVEKVVSVQVSDVKLDQNDDEDDDEQEQEEQEETSLGMMFSKSIKVGKVKLKRDAATVNNVALYGGEQLNTIVNFTNPELLKRIHLAAEVLTEGF